MAIADFQNAPVRLSKLQPLWHRSAPKKVASTCPPDDPLRGWSSWRKHLRRRNRPIAPPFLKPKDPALLWGWAGEWARSEAAAALAAPQRLAESILSAGPAVGTPTDALQLTLLTYALPELARSLVAESWWQLIELLHEVAISTEQARLSIESDTDDVLRYQLLAGEMPLALAYLFPEVRPLRDLREPASLALSESLLELTDGQGLPHARFLPQLAPLFACWTRCRWMGERLAENCWSDEADLQYQWLVRHALRLAAGDGQFMLAERDDSDELPWPKRLFQMSLELSGDRADWAAAATTLPSRVVARSRKIRDKDLPHPALNSEWSGAAVLASGWDRSAVRLAVSYADEPMQIELWLGRERFMIGDWTFSTTSDGQPVHPIGEWEELCWQSETDFDLLELGIDLSGGLRLDRQLLLARDDRVLYLADMVIASDSSAPHLTHSIGLPLSREIVWQPERDTRDGLLLGTKRRAAVLPLALSEWRTDPRGGSLGAEDGQLVLSQEASGRALCCPLFFDFNSRRLRKERTWRQLTVGEALLEVPRDAAVGYRAQSGRDQWLFYRSLGPAGNRTVLGQNIAGEFCAGRFRKSGKLDEWIEIEAP